MPRSGAASVRTALLLAAAVAISLPLGAQTLYKWIDAQGRVQYSDKPPKDFKGEVTKLESDPLPTATVPARPASPKAAPEAAPPATDLNAQRRAIRERLGANVKLAREKLERARKALAEAGGPEPEERQVIQQRVAQGGGNPKPLPIPNTDPTQGRTAGGGMHGMTARSNCREVTLADGKTKTVICPTSVPGEAYFDRVRRLEEEVAKAEEELEAAQTAYRRGVD